jgi:hypothetical protein
MALEDLLVCIDPTSAGDARLKLAFNLARANKAHLSGAVLADGNTAPRGPRDDQSQKTKRGSDLSLSQFPVQRWRPKDQPKQKAVMEEFHKPPARTPDQLMEAASRSAIRRLRYAPERLLPPQRRLKLPGGRHRHSPARRHRRRQHDVGLRGRSTRFATCSLTIGGPRSRDPGTEGSNPASSSSESYKPDHPDRSRPQYCRFEAPAIRRVDPLVFYTPSPGLTLGGQDLAGIPPSAAEV